MLLKSFVGGAKKTFAWHESAACFTRTQKNPHFQTKNCVQALSQSSNESRVERKAKKTVEKSEDFNFMWQRPKSIASKSIGFVTVLNMPQLCLRRKNMFITATHKPPESLCVFDVNSHNFSTSNSAVTQLINKFPYRNKKTSHNSLSVQFQQLWCLPVLLSCLI